MPRIVPRQMGEFIEEAFQPATLSSEIPHGLPSWCRSASRLGLALLLRPL